MKFKQFLKYNKEGMIIGAIGATVYVVYAFKIGIFNAMSTVQNTEFIPSGITTQVIFTYIFFLLMGIGIGAFFDATYKPRR